MEARQKIDAALTAKIAFESLRDRSSMADLRVRYKIHGNQIYTPKKQLLEEAVRAF